MSCFVKPVLNTPCEGRLCPRSSFDSVEAEVMRRRTGSSRIDNACEKHKKDVLTFYPLRQTSCCAPFGRHSKAIKSNLIEIMLPLVHEVAELGVLSAPLIPGKKLCVNCNSKMKTRIEEYRQGSTQAPENPPIPPPKEEQKESNNQNESQDLFADETEEHKKAGGEKTQDNVEIEGSQDYDEVFPTPPDSAILDLNKCLAALGLSPVDVSKLKKLKRYMKDKIEEIKSKVVSKFERLTGAPQPELHQEGKEFEEMLDQLKERFASADRKVRIQIISVLPKSWSLQKVADTFEVSMSFVRTVRALISEQGGVILPSPYARTRQGLDKFLIDEVIKFYHDNSRMLPGAKDVVSVRIEGVRQPVQKELVLSTLRELHEHFREEKPQCKISFSKFADLRPRQCVLAGASGTHSVCVCIYHENFSLMIEPGKFEKLENGKFTAMKMSEVLKLALCSTPTPDCYLRSCEFCPGALPIQEHLETHFDSEMQTHVQFKKWTTTDRAKLETCVLTVEDYIEAVLEVLPSVLEHHFLTIAQSKFLKDLKDGLKPNDCLVMGDFSENYSPVVQDAIQGVHWNTDQITVHPFVCYYRKNSDSELEVINFTIISDYLEHNSLAVYTFQHRLIAHLKTIIPGLQKIFYLTDGAASQYKNRQIALNLRHHIEDFNVEAEWHYCASCHGKGPCDGCGGKLKREANRENLRRVKEDPIITAFQLWEWASKVFSKSTTLELVTVAQVQETLQKYSSRFENTPPLNGISSCHCVLPLSKKCLAMKLYSSADTCQYVYYGELETPNIEDVHGFVIFDEPSSWQLALVLDKNEETQTVEVSLLERVESARGQRNIFSLPDVERRQVIQLESILTVANVSVTAGNKFKLPQKTSKYAMDLHRKRFPLQRQGQNAPKKRKQSC